MFFLQRKLVKRIFFCVLFVILTNRVGDALRFRKLLLTVFYESSCPDSKSFILQQLLPAMPLLLEHVKMQFVPFGKATSIDYGFGGFECQHGFPECFGNMVQDCTLHLMQSRTDLERLNYVACEMDTGAGTRQNFSCASKSGVPPESVEHCIVYGKGTNLQLDSEYRTSLIKPTFIPTVTVDNEFNQQFQESAMTDLLGTLCSFLKETAPCASHFNNLAWHYVIGASYAFPVGGVSLR